jgi:membrane protein YdbS with pleckstrin-like domain
MAKIPEKGLMYKTARISYITNYCIVVLLIVFLFLLWQKFNLSFTFSPKTVEELTSVLIFFAFFIVIAYLIEEPAIERLIRQYLVTDDEVVKIEGIIRKKRIAIPYQSVADVRVIKGVIGRIFNFGNIEVSGFKDAITMKGLRNPEEIYRIIQNKIARFRGGPRIRRIKAEEE